MAELKIVILVDPSGGELFLKRESLRKQKIIRTHFYCYLSKQYSSRSGKVFKIHFHF